jgi:hypothetical protein
LTGKRWTRPRGRKKRGPSAATVAISDRAPTNARELLQQGYQFPIDEGAFPVFAACVGKIGLLPSDLAGKVTEFYGYAAGIVRDFKTLDTRDLNHVQAAKFRTNLVKWIDDLEAKAASLVPELRKEAARSWIESP